MTPKQRVRRKYPHARAVRVLWIDTNDWPQWAIVNCDTGRGLSTLHPTPREAWRGAAQALNQRARPVRQPSPSSPAPPVPNTAGLFE